MTKDCEKFRNFAIIKTDNIIKIPQSHFIELKVFLCDEYGLDMNSIRVDSRSP